MRTVSRMTSRCGNRPQAGRSEHAAGRRWTAFSGLLAVCAMIVIAGAVDPRVASQGNWPMFRGNPQLTGVAAGSLPDKLSLIWTYSTGGKNDAIESSAAIVDGVVYVGSTGSTQGFLHAINLSDGTERWKYDSGAGAVKSSPAVADGKVFFGDENGVFHAVRASDGEPIWKYDTGSGAEIISSANVVGDRVLFGSYDETLYCLSVADGKVLWQLKTQGYVHCTPAVSDGQTFISGCDGLLRVIDIATGKEIASCEMESQAGASPAIVGDRLFVGHFGNQVISIAWKKPEIVWRYEHPQRQFPYYSSPAVAADLVMIGGRDKMVHALDTRTGVERWSFVTKGRVDSSPVVAGKRVFVGSADGHVYGLDLSGNEVWRFATGAPLSASPAVAGGRLVIGNEEGKLFCFGEKI